jgi:hypothetical protein
MDLDFMGFSFLFPTFMIMIILPLCQYLLLHSTEWQDDCSIGKDLEVGKPVEYHRNLESGYLMS